MNVHCECECIVYDTLYREIPIRQLNRAKLGWKLIYTCRGEEREKRWTTLSPNTRIGRKQKRSSSSNCSSRDITKVMVQVILYSNVSMMFWSW